MKIFHKKKLIAGNVCDCVGIKSLFGLRFKKSFKPYDCFLIYMVFDSVLDSFFVNFPFYAIWVNNKGEVLKIEKCEKNKFFNPVLGQSKVIEFPIDKKLGIKLGDKLEIRK